MEKTTPTNKPIIIPITRYWVSPLYLLLFKSIPPIMSIISSTNFYLSIILYNPLLRNIITILILSIVIVS
ncbi:hypothetical protein CBB2_0758 [Clostridium botulinum]|nr:hypothetical protein CBB2_0758 [Clostridium botulinum]